ncbi:MAG: hypothetical protein L6R41_004948 [Letrouitia leprolyta]|nr:MAG: hypothetical protein L6R41_004948 [Letrouitia leprolyta]
MPQAHDKRTPLPQQQYIAPSQSNGAKGQQKRGGPRPARHIPWPEIFKHHISLVEGHMKMIDMVRKHTVEGTNNHRTICELIDRSKDMLYQAKKTARSFVPPPNQLEQVPLGSSSDTMYPGYSPGHFEYGKAAEEFGRYASEAKRQGKDVKLEGVDYELGQSKGLGHLSLAKIRAAKGEKSATGSGSDSGEVAGLSGSATGTSKGQVPNGGDETHNAGDQMFFMDSNPTPVDLPGIANSSAKRVAPPEPVEANISKKQKKKHSGRAAQSDDAAEEPLEPVRVEFEDIAGEVDARLKEKEEKRKLKQQEKEAKKKRKRESEGSSAITAEARSVTDILKPKNKKIKESDDSNKASATLLKKRSALDDEEGAEGSSAAVAAEKPRKKTKVSREKTSGEKTKKRQSAEVGAGDEHPKKKKKSRTSGLKTIEDTKKKRTADEEATAEVTETEGKAKKKRKTVDV